MFHWGLERHLDILHKPSKCCCEHQYVQLIIIFHQHVIWMRFLPLLDNCLGESPDSDFQFFYHQIIANLPENATEIAKFLNMQKNWIFIKKINRFFR